MGIHTYVGAPGKNFSKFSCSILAKNEAHSTPHHSHSPTSLALHLPMLLHPHLQGPPIPSPKEVFSVPSLGNLGSKILLHNGSTAKCNYMQLCGESFITFYSIWPLYE